MIEAMGNGRGGKMEVHMGDREGGDRRDNGRAVGRYDGRTAQDRAGAWMDVFKKSYSNFR